MRSWCGYLHGVWCRLFAYSLAGATATSSLASLDWFNFSLASLPIKEAIKRMSVCLPVTCQNGIINLFQVWLYELILFWWDLVSWITAIQCLPVQMASRDSTLRQMSAAVVTTAPFVNAAPSLSLISQTSPLQPDALLSVGNVVTTTSSAALSSTDLLEALSHRTIPQSTSTSGDLLPDLGLLNLTTSSSLSATTAATGSQQPLLGISGSNSQPLAPSDAKYSLFSADMTDVDYQSTYCGIDV